MPRCVRALSNCSGAAGVAATLPAMRDGVVPPTFNVDEPDPDCDLDYVPAESRKLDVEYVVANCIAFGETDRVN
jgi:3-oxoacyl-[acyl-carrier-protein] synthase II